MRVHCVGADHEVLHSLGVTAGQIARHPAAARVTPHGRPVRPCGVQYRNEIRRHFSRHVCIGVVRGVAVAVSERVDGDDVPVSVEGRRISEVDPVGAAQSVPGMSRSGGPPPATVKSMVNPREAVCISGSHHECAATIG